MSNIAKAPAAGAEGLTFVGIKQQAARLRAEIEGRLHGVLDHGAFIAGPEIAELEAELARRSGAKSVIACSSGTDALIIPLLAESLGPEDAVFIPTFTYNATANAVLLSRATPVFVDVDEASFNLCPKDLERRVAEVKAAGKLTPRAVIAVDLFGLPADFPALQGICDREGMLLMADSAQSFGGGIGEARVGALAPVTATSFFPTKTLGGYGDGGAIFAMDEQRAEIWEQIRWHGTDSARKESIRIGMNGRLDSFQAAVLLAKLGIFDEEYETRAMVAGVYHERLGNRVAMQSVPDGVRHAWGLFSVLAEDRDGVRQKLQDKGVPTAIYYTQALHEMAAFEEFAPKGGLPVAESLTKRIFSLPIHPYMTETQAHFVCDSLLDVLDDD